MKFLDKLLGRQQEYTSLNIGQPEVPLNIQTQDPHTSLAEPNSSSKEQSPDQEFSMFGLTFKGSEGAEDIEKKLKAEDAKKYIRRSGIIGVAPPLFLIIILFAPSGFDFSGVKFGRLLTGLVILGYICWASYWGTHSLILQVQEESIAESRLFWAFLIGALGPIFLALP
jgi:hypothetical protein